MQKGTEIERKFLITGKPENLPEGPRSFKGTIINQGYLEISLDGSEKRVRRKGNKFYLTQKSGRGKVRIETEGEISEENFARLWPLTEGRRIEKTRFEIPQDGPTIELDVFGGGLLGLVIAEVEFGRLEDSLSFTPPAWFGQEVTEDERFKNQQLALHGIPR